MGSQDLCHIRTLPCKFSDRAKYSVDAGYSARNDSNGRSSLGRTIVTAWPFNPRPASRLRLIACILIAAFFAAAAGPARAQHPLTPTYEAVPAHPDYHGERALLERLPPPMAISIEDQTTFNLEDLVAIAQQRSPLLAQAAADIEMARGRTWQAGLYPNPVAMGGAMQLGGSESQYYAQLSQEIVTRKKLQLSEAAAG